MLIFIEVDIKHPVSYMLLKWILSFGAPDFITHYMARQDQNQHNISKLFKFCVLVHVVFIYLELLW